MKEGLSITGDSHGLGLHHQASNMPGTFPMFDIRGTKNGLILTIYPFKVVSSNVENAESAKELFIQTQHIASLKSDDFAENIANAAGMVINAKDKSESWKGEDENESFQAKSERKRKEIEERAEFLERQGVFKNMLSSGSNNKPETYVFSDYPELLEFLSEKMKNAFENPQPEGDLKNAPHAMHMIQSLGSLL